MQATPVIFSAGDRVALVEPSVLARIASYVEPGERSLEAGGILIGCYRNEVIDTLNLTRPMKGDLRRGHSFIRQDPGHKSTAFRAWKASGRTTTVVGEWHTHPWGEGSPSTTDYDAWRSALRNAQGLGQLFVIMTPSALWVGLGDGQQVVRMHPRVSNALRSALPFPL